MLKLYNTLTRKKEEFKPIKKGRVGMYVCGPTVNDIPHLGHARQQITFDTLRRVLKYNGLKVKFVSNITDIEDKIINKARELNEDIQTLVKRNIKAHSEDYAKIGIQAPDVQPKATEYIKEMIALIKKLEEKGYTYIIEGDGVYYDISKFKDYGKLSHQNIETKKKKSRIKAKEEKRNNEDFVLWKFSKPDEPSWDSPWGAGRPGWHIECSAMSASILDLPFDIHGGGQDLIFPHHEDEIAQTEAAYDKKMANFWVHNGMVNINKIKMSKSLGNFTTIRDLLEEYQPEVIRYFILLTQYRNPLDFSKDNLDAAKTTYERIKNRIIELKKEYHKGEDKTSEYDSAFLEAINDDLNTPKALQIFYKALDDFDFDTKRKLALLEKFDEVLGLGIKNIKEEKISIPKEVQNLIESREKLRKDKKFAEADVLRERIKEKGFIVKDTPRGPEVSKAE
ncbi:MAG: cysteine--tRNA ligase [Candidatus Pacearchaeota archaeon]